MFSSVSVGQESGPTCLFVDLDGGLVAIDPNNFSYQLVVAHFHLPELSISSLCDRPVGRRILRTSSYIATPIMSSATMTGLYHDVSNGVADIRG